MNNQIAEQLKDIIIDYLGDDEIIINEESLLTDDLGLSSLDLISIVGSIEDGFNIIIEDNEVPSIRTFKDAVDFIDNKVKD